MPALYPTRSRLRLLQAVKDQQVLAIQTGEQTSPTFLDLSVVTNAGGKVVTSAIDDMMRLQNPWVRIDDVTPIAGGRLVALTALGELLLGAENPAKVAGL